MNQMMKNLWKDEEGATALEYAILVALIALGITIGVGAFGTALDGFFSDIATKVPLAGN